MALMVIVAVVASALLVHDLAQHHWVLAGVTWAVSGPLLIALYACHRTAEEESQCS